MPQVSTTSRGSDVIPHVFVPVAIGTPGPGGARRKEKLAGRLRRAEARRVTQTQLKHSVRKSCGVSEASATFDRSVRAAPTRPSPSPVRRDERGESGTLGLFNGRSDANVRSVH